MISIIKKIRSLFLFVMKEVFLSFSLTCCLDLEISNFFLRIMFLFPWYLWRKKCFLLPWLLSIFLLDGLCHEKFSFFFWRKGMFSWYNFFLSVFSLLSVFQFIQSYCLSGNLQRGFAMKSCCVIPVFSLSSFMSCSVGCLVWKVGLFFI